MKAWPKIALGEPLRHSDETACIDPTREYHKVIIKLWGRGIVSRGQVRDSDVVSVRRMVRANQLILSKMPDVGVDRTATYRLADVYSFGRGVFPSVIKQGSEFVYERLSAVQASDFTYPKLMAWEGALGIVPTECDGMVVSPEFPVFSVNTDEVLPKVLNIYFRTPEVWPGLSEISGGRHLRRRRLQPSAFLNDEMPVPSMATQRKLRDLHRHTQALRSRHAGIRAANAALLPATLERVFSGGS